MPRPPLWGNFVDHADEDFLAFGILSVNGLVRQASYHGTQAIEKYLKALILSIIDPQGSFATPLTELWVKTHNLQTLSNRCVSINPFYSSQSTLESLERLSEFDQAARYPWVEQKYGNGFSDSDIPIFGELIRQIRTDLPIHKDDYQLGMEVRGHFHLSKNPDHTRDFYPHHGVEALRSLFPNINDFVRW